MEWYVFYDEINRNTIEQFNIFDHSRFADGCARALEKNADNRENFAEDIRLELMYYFWCKCEWEVVISGFPPSPKDKPRKVDVYSQVMLNFQRFIDYLWDNQNKLKEYKLKRGI